MDKSNSVNSFGNFTVRFIGVKGFTLIELLVVLAVIAILVTIALFGLKKAQASARDASRQQTVRAIQAALEKFYADNASYPGTPATASDWVYIAAATVDQQQAMMYKLVNGNYIVSTALPVDPCPPGNQTIIASGKNGIPANGAATCPTVTYVYTPAGCSGVIPNVLCTSYTINLAKEGGGTSTFKSPT